MLCVWIYVLYVLILTLLLAVDLVLMYSWPSILISELIDWNLGLIVSQMLFALFYSVWSERLSQQKGNCISSSLLHPFISSSLTSQVSFHLSLLPPSIFSHFMTFLLPYPLHPRFLPFTPLITLVQWKEKLDSILKASFSSFLFFFCKKYCDLKSQIWLILTKKSGFENVNLDAFKSMSLVNTISLLELQSRVQF